MADINKYPDVTTYRLNVGENPNRLYGSTTPNAVNINNKTYSVPKYSDVINSKTGDTRVTNAFDLESKLIRGTMAFSPERMQEIDPSYTGHTHIFVLRVPPILTAVASSKVVDLSSNGTEHKIQDGSEAGYLNLVDEAKLHIRNLKALFELGSTGYSGTPDLTMNYTPYTGLFEDQAIQVPTYSSYGSTQFNLTVMEFR